MTESKLNAAIAILVSISAVFISVFNIKDGNIVQAMSQSQAHAIDAWSYYQAKSTKQHIAENSKDQLQTQLAINDRLNKAANELLHGKISFFEAQIQKYDKEKAEIKTKAEDFQKEYDTLNIRDDQFDIAEAFLSISIALFGIAALTQQTRLCYFAVGLSSLGILFGISGFAGWNLHPDWLAAFLS
jgi:hypothetical protein